MSALPFALGRCVITNNAAASLDNHDVHLALQRHASGDWGDICADDRQANEQALIQGLRLFSVYHDRNGKKFYIITERDRSLTTVLLPEDY